MYIKIFTAVFYFAASSVFPHTIFMRDLKVIYGIVYSQDGQFVYFNSHEGKKKLRKDTISRILIQDVTDETALKSILKKVKRDNPGYVTPNLKEPPPSTNIANLEVESTKYLLTEIEEEERVLVVKEKGRTAVLRSLYLPGYGEYTIGKEKTGIIYGSLFGSALAAAAYFHSRAQSSYSKYTGTVSENVKYAYIINPYFSEQKSTAYFGFSLMQQSAAYHDYEKRIATRNALGAAALGIYLIQIFHTLRDVQSLPAGSSERLKVDLFPVRESMTAFGRAESGWGIHFSVSSQF